MKRFFNMETKNKTEDVSIFITTKVSNNEQLEILKTAMEYAHKWYPNNKIFIIDDNSETPILKNMFTHKNTEIIKSEFPGAGELLRLYYYFYTLKPTKWAICVHDSQFINSVFKIPNEPYQFLFYATHTYDQPPYEINLIKSLKNNELTAFYNHYKLDWHVAFGVQCMVSWNFLAEVNRKLPNWLKIIAPQVKTRVDRMCMERITSCIFSFIRLAKQAMFGDIFAFTYKITHGYKSWGMTYREFLAHRHELENAPTIKVWVGR